MTEFEREDIGDKSVFASFRLASDRISLLTPCEHPELYTPGQDIGPETGLLRGHGTYQDNGRIKASVAGVLEHVNKLIMIRPLKSRYNGEIGDVVIGRITEIQQKRWRVDANARLDAVLLLSSVNLPGGELRRRSVEDERMMRQYLSEGDLISAEVQNVFSEGTLSLHTRNLKYGKLSQGVLVTVPAPLIKRSKTHFHTICGISLIIGTNGYIWLYPTPKSTEEGAGGFARNLELRVEPREREAIARMQCCINALAESRMMVYDTSLVAAFEVASKFSVKELLKPEVKLEIVMLTQHMMGLNC